MLRLTTLSLIWSILGISAVAQVSRQDAVDWNEYLNGSWTTVTTFGTEVTQGTVRFGQQENTTVVIGRFTEAKRNGVEIGGWQTDRRIAQVNGYTSAGDWYELKYSELSANGGEGPMQGTLLGNRYTGHFVAKVLDKDTMKWVLKGKKKNGTEFTVSADLTRKRQ